MRKLPVPAKFQQLGEDIAWALTKMDAGKRDADRWRVAQVKGVSPETIKGYRRKTGWINNAAQPEFADLVPARSRSLFRELFPTSIKRR